MATSPFAEVLLTPLHKVVPKRDIVTTAPSATLGMATLSMSAHQCASLPIMDGAKFHGFISMKDIAAYAVQSRLFDCNSESEYMQKKVDLEHKTIVPHLVKNTKKTEGCLRNMSNPLYEAIELFAMGSIHRIAMMAPDFSVTNICSQSDVARFLFNAMKSAGTESPLFMAAHAAPMKSSQCVSMHFNEKLSEAFALMVDDDVSTLAVVDDQGKLVGNLSHSDYAAVNFANIDALNLSVGRFLTQFRPKALNPVAVPTTTSLFAALETLVSHKLHSLWVVDAEGKPVHSLSLTDVMRTVRDLRLTPASARDRNSLPGKLSFFIHSVSGVEATRATVTLVAGDRVITRATEEEGKLEAGFDFNLLETDVGAMVTLTLFNGANEEVGSRDFTVQWMLEGFGTGNPAAISTEDGFPMSSSNKGFAHLKISLTPASADQSPDTDARKLHA